ncbi:extracellular catalytic domain type 1 short-chain-length polyhydroxyalkanoate depolymerase [Sinorhizobium fredii]|uniref:extracellular catalytic domain type 1 short-chain-length polyhydroxyalkanoate depolymerase n=1 Tax=Rhizobium fredii TaxID=380 RepID=UPI00059571FD|nr:PHB depolymerase family esterase [Sinorhizobium fredii]WOS62436.1 PHB depolymerase family esterase [Sinorhizobium fredii GR64]
MNDDFATAMRRAVRSTRALNLAEATRVIQDALAGRSASDTRTSTNPDITPPPPNQRSTPFPVDPDAEIIEPSAKPEAEEPAEKVGDGAASRRLRKSLGETVRILRESRLASGVFGSLHDVGLPGTAKHVRQPVIPEGAQFLARAFTCPAGSRSYRLYVPASAPDRPRGLVVMLHGCTQDPEDFAAGTGMNAVAETHGLAVAYPRQSGADNTSSCWNWFRPADQMRDGGEPSIIAGITKEIMAEFGLDRDRVFVAGLSAGGAMAAVMGETYPDLYSAAGIHSGLPYGSANDVMSAFSAMRGDGGLAPRPKRLANGHRLRTIVFQGGADRTVHPSNADRIVAAAAPTGVGCAIRKESGRSASGRTYARTIVADPAGRPAVEYWLVDGAGHAWSGGHSAGTYTDPHGPDASCQMVRFFLDGQE